MLGSRIYLELPVKLQARPGKHAFYHPLHELNWFLVNHFAVRGGTESAKVTGVVMDRALQSLVSCEFCFLRVYDDDEVTAGV